MSERRIVRRVSGVSTTGMDDTLIDNRGVRWTDSRLVLSGGTMPTLDAEITFDGRVIVTGTR